MKVMSFLNTSTGVLSVYLDHSTSVEDIKALHVLPPSPTDKTVIIDMKAATTDSKEAQNE